MSRIAAARPLRRRALLGAGLAAGLPLWAPQARACEFFSATLRVTHPWARATLESEDSARVFMRFDEVTEDDRLIGVKTMVAGGATLAGPGVAGDGVDFAIPRGRTSLLSEQGVHLLLTDLQWQLQVARAYPMQLIFEKGGVLNASLSIDFPRFG